MNHTISGNRIFSLSCFEGFRLLRKYMQENPFLPIVDLLALIESVEADAHSLDMEASTHLSKLVEMDCPLDGHVFYQTCIKSVVLNHRPIWSKGMAGGLRRFIKGLDSNDHDVFAAAGLMETPISYDVLTWWDDISGFARLLSNQEKMKQARDAELLTLKYEQKRLKGLGIQKKPEWPGLDDNFAGYDVLSYDLAGTNIKNRMIEVKSTIQSPMRIIVTSNEWEKAEKFGDTYFFYIWEMRLATPRLHIRAATDIACHVPLNNGMGKWKTSEIPIHT